jgi:hypothetical protein
MRYFFATHLFRHSGGHFYHTFSVLSLVHKAHDNKLVHIWFDKEFSSGSRLEEIILTLHLDYFYNRWDLIGSFFSRVSRHLFNVTHILEFYSSSFCRK